MNINDVLEGRFNVAAHLEQLAKDLEAAGHALSAAEIRREIRGMIGRLMDLDKVLNNHKVAIYVTQEEGNAQAAHHWLSMIEKGVA